MEHTSYRDLTSELLVKSMDGYKVRNPCQGLLVGSENLSIEIMYGHRAGHLKVCIRHSSTSSLCWPSKSVFEAPMFIPA